VAAYSPSAACSRVLVVPERVVVHASRRNTGRPRTRRTTAMLGVTGIISPFNFPATVPMWFFPIAIASGNTVVDLINANPYGNGTALFTNDGGVARRL
jgi:acyl-CoA reductase-like NAD-dependent aldehyde dehydrogenase